jgi:Integrase core domain
MKKLEAENARLRRAVSDLTLDKMIPAEAARGNCWAPRAAAPASTMFEANWDWLSAGSAGCLGSIDPPSGRFRGDQTMRNGWLPTSSSWLDGTWENGFIESFNARLRDELLDGEIFYSLAEARIAIESWRRHYNTVRPHGSLGYKPPAPEVFIPGIAARVASQPPPAAPPALAQSPSMN